jgi:RES domain-containing protein
LIVHRLAKQAFVSLDGEGARLYGGRWNSPGRPMIYAAGSPSLALLEILVHLDLPPELIPNDYRLLSIHVPDDAPVQRLDDAPADPRATGDGFLAAGEALVLSVSSVIVPQERNALINPRHAAAAGLRVEADVPFGFDRRLF